ncbi:MAG: hypothetical protein ACFCUH_12920 [Flavobacteriales bacterium]
MRKTFLTAIAAVLIGTLFVSCGGDASSTDAGITEDQAVEMAAETKAIEESLQKAEDISKKIEEELKSLDSVEENSSTDKK